MPNHVHGIIVIETVEADHPSIVRATRPSVDEIRETHDSPVDPMKDRLDGSPRQMVRATRLPVDEMRDTNDILVDQMKNNLDGSPRQEADETRGTNDSPVDPMEDNLDGSPRQEADEIRGTYDILVDPMKDRSDGSPQQTKRPNGPQTNSLGAMIGQFKSRATKRIWALTEINRHPIWQRNYYEHIIRDDLEYRRIVQYIETNPLQWHDDQLHPIMQR